MKPTEYIKKETEANFQAFLQVDALQKNRQSWNDWTKCNILYAAWTVRDFASEPMWAIGGADVVPFWSFYLERVRSWVKQQVRKGHLQEISVLNDGKWEKRYIPGDVVAPVYDHLNKLYWK